MKLFFFSVFILTVQIVLSQNKTKQNPILTDKLLVSAGVFSPLKQVKLGADGSIPTAISEDIDFGEAFKLEGIQNTFTFNFMWRFSKNKKWSVSGDYFRIGSENKAVLEEDIVWEDLIFKAGSKIEGGFGLSLFKIFFGRVISRGEKHEFGGGFGFHALNVGAFIEGNAIINSGEDDENISFKRNEVSVVLPLPNIGFWYFYAPTEKWALTARMEWFGIKIGDISGVLWNINPGVNYQAFKNIGLSLNYKFLQIAANVDKDSWKGDFSMQFQGPSFTVTANF